MNAYSKDLRVLVLDGVDRGFPRQERNAYLLDLSLEGMGASMSIEGSADGEAFLLYVEHFLCPTLKRGQVVLMDNLQVHKTKKVRELIEKHGCQLVNWFSCRATLPTSIP